MAVGISQKMSLQSNDAGGESGRDEEREEESWRRGR